MSTTKLKSASEFDHPLDQYVDKERQLQRAERECYRHKLNSLNLKKKVGFLEKEQESLEKNLDDKTQEVESLREVLANQNTKLLLAQKEMEHLTENNFIKSSLQQILNFISSIIIAIGVAFFSTNVGVILIFLGIFVFVTSFFPIFLDGLKYLKARKQNP